jgi:glycolate oxidase FAD binding subunit
MSSALKELVAPLAEPHDDEQLVAVLAEARAKSQRVLVIGNGSALSRTLVSEHVDLVLSTRHLSGVVQHVPAEGVVTARAGTTMAALAEHVGRGGLALSPAVPHPERATLGGVVSGARSGIDRMSAGPVRDQVLGVKLALADGRVVKSGGALVKDVAGYDLHHLVVGAHGRLGVVLEVSLRLAPLPQSRALVVRPCASLAEGVRLAFAVEERCPAARFVRVDGDARGAHVFLELVGRTPVVDEQIERAARVLGASDVLRDAAAVARFAALRDGMGNAPSTEPTFEFDMLPSRVDALLVDVARAAGSAAWRAEVHPRPGLVTIASAALHDPKFALALAATARTQRAALQTSGLTRDVHTRVLDALGPPAGLELMRGIAAALDPTGLFAAPRLHTLP